MAFTEKGEGSVVDLKRQYRGFIPGIILQFYRKKATAFPRFEFYREHMYPIPPLYYPTFSPVTFYARPCARCKLL